MDKNKRGLKLVSVALQVTKQLQKYLFISYILSDQNWLCNIKCFLGYSKNYICKFIHANSWNHKLFHFDLSFESGKCEKERKNWKKSVGISFKSNTRGVLHFLVWWEITRSPTHISGSIFELMATSLKRVHKRFYYHQLRVNKYQL